jgi:hypothetical protein
MKSLLLDASSFFYYPRDLGIFTFGCGLLGGGSLQQIDQLFILYLFRAQECRAWCVPLSVFLWTEDEHFLTTGEPPNEAFEIGRPRGEEKPTIRVRFRNCCRWIGIHQSLSTNTSGAAPWLQA